MAFQSCSNLQITKRKYRQGFHIQTKAKAELVQVGRTHKLERAADHPTKVNLEKLSTINPVELEIPEQQSEVLTASIKEPPTFLNVDLESRLIQETRRVKRDNRKSFLKPAEVESEWSKSAIISMALGGTGVLVAIGSLILLAVAQNNGGVGSDYGRAGLIIALSNILIGLGAVFFGVGAKKEIHRYGHRGRGLRKAGFVTGLVSLGSVIGFLFMALILLANSCQQVN